MATLDEFMAQYQAYYGKFPLELDKERDREALAVWRRWIAPITPDKMDRIFKTLNDHRASQGTRVKPLLEAFRRAESGALRGAEFTSPELRDAQEKMKTPLFDFSKEGFPRRREAFLIELPRKTIKRFSESWGDLTSRIITSDEFKKRSVAEDWYLPEWHDYETAKKKRICLAWGIGMPKEEEVPF